jgi:hypothetical protein
MTSSRSISILVSIASILMGAMRVPALAKDLPFVSIALPPNVPSESVQIAYYLVGPFGGYGGYGMQQFGVHSYQIPTVVDGKAAAEFRAIVYASGCKIQRFVIPLSEQSRVSREFVCQSVETVRLSGQIVPSELARYGNAELVFTCMARWAHGFFGIADGPVTHFELAKTPPQADGRFDVNLPLVSQEATDSEPQASVCLMLRDSRTLNHIASNLEPDDAELRSEYHCLQIRRYYPVEMKFKAVNFEKSMLRGRVFRSDSGQPISNSYILLANDQDQEKHFDTRTDEAGNYIFGHVPAGNYTVSIYAWFGRRDEVPCQDPLKQKTADSGDIAVEWQRKSQAFMEIVTLKGFSIELEREDVKDFDLVGR